MLFATSIAGINNSKSSPNFSEIYYSFYLSVILISKSLITPLKNTSKHSETLTSMGPNSISLKISYARSLFALSKIL